MGTTPNGKKPSTDITISRSSTSKIVDPVTGKSVSPENQPPERSFAQPSPIVPPKVVTPKAYGSEKDQKEALLKNSVLKKLPKVGDDEELAKE